PSRPGALPGPLKVRQREAVRLRDVCQGETPGDPASRFLELTEIEDPHDLVAEMIDGLDRDLTGVWLDERHRRGPVQSRPSIQVDLRLERLLQRIERVAATTSEVGVSHEEGL